MIDRRKFLAGILASGASPYIARGRIVGGRPAWHSMVSAGAGAGAGGGGYSASMGGSTANYINAPSLADVAELDSQATLSFWVKGAAGQETGWAVGIESDDTRYRAIFNGAGRYIYWFNFGIEDYAATGYPLVMDGNWHHHCWVSYASTNAFYLDGVATGVTMLSGSNTGKWVANINRNFLKFYIGRSTDASSSFEIANVAYLRSSHSPSEVAAMYNAQYLTAAQFPSLEAQFILNGDATDTEGNHNGTEYGTVNYTFDPTRPATSP